MYQIKSRILMIDGQSTAREHKNYIYTILDNVQHDRVLIFLICSTSCLISRTSTMIHTLLYITKLQPDPGKCNCSEQYQGEQHQDNGMVLNPKSSL